MARCGVLSLLSWFFHLLLVTPYVPVFAQMNVSVVNSAVPVTNPATSWGLGGTALLVTQQNAAQVAYPNSNLIAAYGGVPVFLTLNVVSISHIDGVENQFQCDFYILAQWPDNSTCTQAAAAANSCAFDSNNNWLPQLEFINLYFGQIQALVGAPYSFGTQAPTFSQFLPIWPNRDVSQEDWGGVWVTFNQRFTAVFSTNLRLYDFPFDSQAMVIQIESGVYTSDLLQYTIPFNQNTTFLPQSNFEIVEWNILQPNCTATILPNFYYPQFLQNYSRVQLLVPLQRQSFFYVNKIIVGVVLLVLMTIFTFAFTVDVTDRMMGSFSSFAALVGYLFVTTASVPKIAYTTRLDEFLLLSFMMVFFIAVYHGFAYMLREKHNERSAKKLASLLSKVDVLRNAVHQLIDINRALHGNNKNNANDNNTNSNSNSTLLSKPAALHHDVDGKDAAAATTTTTLKRQNTHEGKLSASKLSSSSLRDGETARNSEGEKEEGGRRKKRGRNRSRKPQADAQVGFSRRPYPMSLATDFAAVEKKKETAPPPPPKRNRLRVAARNAVAPTPPARPSCECCPVHFPTPKHPVRLERTFAKRFPSFSFLPMSRRFDFVFVILFTSVYVISVLAILLRPPTYDPTTSPVTT